MAASYPTSVKSFSTKSTTDVVEASHPNDLQDEVTAIEQALVTNGVAHDLKPSTSGTRNLGTSALKWLDLYLSGSVQAANLPNAICDVRLTLTTVTPVTVADVTAATTVYVTPGGKGNRIALYDGTNWQVKTFAELSIALGSDAASLPYDVFAYLNAGTVAVERLAWTNGSTRATALVLQDGVLVKTGDATRRYLGTYRTTATIGQTEDSLANRLVYNHYNQAERPLRRVDTTDTWTYTTDTYRQANGSALNQVAVMIGVAGPTVRVLLTAQMANSTLPTAGTRAYVAIGEDSTSARASGCIISGGDFFVAARRQPAMASLVSAPAAGYHYYSWLERSNADSGTTTWAGDEGNDTRSQSGLSGSVTL